MKTGIGLAAALVLLMPAASLAQKVTTDYDPKADFAAFKTYAWTEGTPSPNPLGEARIRAAVDERMAAKGLKLVAEAPDIVVATHVVAKEQKELNTMGYGGYGWRWGGGMATTSIDTYIQGTLALDVYDAGSKQLVWRGIGTDTASDQPEKNQKKINKALDKMFKDFPPRPKK
jgi:hypothetical protein